MQPKKEAPPSALSLAVLLELLQEAGGHGAALGRVQVGAQPLRPDVAAVGQDELGVAAQQGGSHGKWVQQLSAPCAVVLMMGVQAGPSREQMGKGGMRKLRLS